MRPDKIEGLLNFLQNELYYHFEDDKDALSQDTAAVQKNKIKDVYEDKPKDHPYLLKSTITPHSSETKEVLSRLNVRRSKKDMRSKMVAPVSDVTVGDRHAMRRKILACSLFPNLYNSSMVYSEEGPD
jgi:hypothetical protein